jgi:RNA polymerase sigma factor (sigma-70 family)
MVLQSPAAQRCVRDESAMKKSERAISDLTEDEKLGAAKKRRDPGSSPCRFGSPEAVFAHQYRRMVRVLSAVDGREAAEDAVQDAFVQLFLHWSRVKAYEDQAGWVRRVAVNRLHNRRRSLVRQAAALVRLERQGPPPEESPDMNEGLQDLLAAIQGLPRRRRLTMALYYLDDLSVEEIAVALNVSKGTVTRQLYEGREDLRRRLEE